MSGFLPFIQLFLSLFNLNASLVAIGTAFSKVKNPIHISSIGLLVKRRETIVSKRVRLSAVFRLSVYVFALSLLWCSETLAQSCANYAPVTRATGITYNSIAGSSPSYFTWRNTTLNQNDDNRSYPIPIGFDFWYLGVRYTQIAGSLDGTLDFSTSTSDGNNGGTGPYGPNYNNLFSTANQTMLALAPLYADLWTVNAGTTPIAVSLAYQVSGAAPNRVLTVEWINFDEWNTPVNVPAASVNMQVKIYESTGVIEFIYGTMTAGASGGGSYPLRYTCGINNTWSVGAPNATQLLTQQVANTTTFNNTPQNVLTTLPASNSKLTFTPPIPTATPTGLTFNAITQSGMTINWTDNSTNEVGYVVYNSTDNVNFNFVSQVTADSTSATVTNLSSGTTYYWKVYAVTDGALSSPLTDSQATLPAVTITSIVNGNWNATSTWDCGCIPTAGDNVIIANGTTVNLDINGSCNSLIVGQGVSGQLILGNDATARTLTVGNDVIINSGGTIITGATAATHIMNVGGNLINNGTLNLTPTGTRVCNVTFNKNGNQTVSGTGVTTNFNRITLSMGTSQFNVLDVASSNFSATANFLTLTNGTFKLSTGAVVTPFTGNVTISSSSGIWLDNAAASLSTTGGTITLFGLLRATAGTMNIGSAANNNLTSYGGTIKIDGGTVNVAGRLDRFGPTVLTYFTISSGTLIVATVGSTTAGAAPFRIDEIGSTFNMSGGTIIIRRPGVGNLGYVNTGGTVGIVSGGTLQIGDASTPVAQTIQINSSIAVPNLVIGNGVAVTAQLVTNSLFINNNVSINSGTLNANGLNITLGGVWTNSGTFVGDASTVTLNGLSIQSISGSAPSLFNNLTVNNATGITLGNTATVNGVLTFSSGIITSGSNTLILSSTGNIARTSGHVFGNFQKYVTAGPASIVFEIGDALNYTPVSVQFGNVATAGNLIAKTITGDHPNIANSAIEGTKNVNRYWLLSNNGIVYDNYSATFNFVPGDLDLGADTANFIIQQYYTPSWSTPVIGTRTSASTQAMALTSFGDFAIGNIKTFTVMATSDSNGLISPSGPVIVNYNSNQAFTITPNTGYHVDSLFVDGIHVDSTTSYTFFNVTGPHTIYATFAINVYTIASDKIGNGIITPSGSVNVNYGAEKTFYISPDVGYHFDSLFVDGIHVDSTASYTFKNVTENHTILAKFAIDVFKITASAETGGTINPSGDIMVDYGASQNFIIAPEITYHYDSLFVDGVHVDSTASYTFDNVTANHTIHAKFAINKYIITSTAGANGLISPSGSVNVNQGSDQHFTITPNTGYHVDSLFVDGIHVDSTASYTFNNVTANHTIHAKFAINKYTITSTAGANGLISPSGSVNVNQGSDQHFTITPNTGYHVDSLFVDGIQVDSTTSYTFVNVATNHTIHAIFTINVYTITSSAESGGSINPSGDVKVNHGENKQYTFTPEVGYHKDSLIVDGVPVDSTTSYTFKNIAANHTIRVTFAINDYTITASAGIGGIIDPIGIVHVKYSESRQFTFGPNEGYNFDSLFVDGIHFDSSTSYTFHNVTANHTIHAKFAINKFTISATAGAGGTINPPGAVLVNYGTNKTFIITPNTGYGVDSLIVDGNKVDSTTSYTFNNVIENHTISVKFIRNKLSITANTGPGGTITPFGTVFVDYGGGQQFIVAPDIGYDIDSVFVDGAYVDSTVSYTFNDVTANHTIYAKFVIKKFTITATAGFYGNITPSGTIQVNYGDSVLFTMQPDANCIVDSIFVDGSYAGNDSVYTFKNISLDHTIHVTFTFTAGVADELSRIPKEYALHQNYPNPFNPTTTLQYSLPNESRVKLIIYNVLGQVVEILSDAIESAGYISVEWNAGSIPSGIYFYKLESVSISDASKSFTQVKKMLLVK